MVLSANPRSLRKYSANPGTADSNGKGPRRRLRITGSLQASCSICRTPHSASIICLRTATAVFVLTPCCSNHCEYELLYMRLARSNVSATFLLGEVGKVKKQRQPAIHNKARVTMCLQPFQVALNLRSKPTTTDSVDGRRPNVIIFEHEKPPFGKLRWRSMIRLAAPVM